VVEAMEQKSVGGRGGALFILCENHARELGSHCRAEVDPGRLDASAWFDCDLVTLEAQVKESLTARSTPHRRARADRTACHWPARSTGRRREGSAGRSAEVRERGGGVGVGGRQWVIGRADVLSGMCARSESCRNLYSAGSQQH